MNERLRWGVLGAGHIAEVFGRGVQASRSGRLLAVGSRTKDKAEAFATKLEVPHAYGSYTELIESETVDAVYVATPHPMHAMWAIRALEAGKHVLCEKPLAMNHPEAMAVVEAARRHDRFLMEAFMYRCHPQTARVVELIRDGAIGRVQLIQAAYTFRSRAGRESRLIDPLLGGGGILDVGCYPVSIARLVAAAALGRDTADPLDVRATGTIGEEGSDEYAIASLRFEGGILAQVCTGVRMEGENVLRVTGTEGSLFVPSPFTPGEGRIVLSRGGAVEEITIPCEDNLYALEADAVAANLERRQAPEMSWDDTLGNMSTLDRWRDEIGLVYPADTPDGPGQDRPVHGRPLALSENARMPYGRIEGIDKPVSRLVMGVDNQQTWPQLAVMLDEFFEQGGTCFDTAYIYMGGNSERLLGAWVRQRGVREQAVIVTKGAHTPFCDPENLTSQLETSLERLDTGYVDLYMMHRDNPGIPVGEFLSVLEEHRRAGRVRAYGASNWSLERIQEARLWAQAHDIGGFTVVSNNFSLARMVEPPWAGCVSAADADWRRWLTETQTPLLPWSSQARGFFARGNPGERSDAELVRCWYADDNFARLERARELARERGVEPTAIALAYVLAQPFPAFPLIGPRLLPEMSSSLRALEVPLTEQEVRWLNLETEQRG